MQQLDGATSDQQAAGEGRSNLQGILHFRLHDSQCFAKVSFTQFFTALCRAYHDISWYFACSLICALHVAVAAAASASVAAITNVGISAVATTVPAMTTADNAAVDFDDIGLLSIVL